MTVINDILDLIERDYVITIEPWEKGLIVGVRLRGDLTGKGYVFPVESLSEGQLEKAILACLCAVNEETSVEE